MSRSMTGEGEAKRMRLLTAALICQLCAALLASPGFATTKGLNQIVTPDIQPKGVLSVSFQGQNSAIGNSLQLQLELGLTKSFEIALFRGFQPADVVLGAELGLVRSRSFLVSTGLLDLQGEFKAQPFIEAGYYAKKQFVIAGVQEQGGPEVGIFGYGYQVSPKILAMADYLGGSENFATAGLTLDISPTLSFNPAIYISNSSPHRAFGYAVLTYNITLWR